MIVDAKFIYRGGKYIEFRGYPFANYQPTRIRDGATLEALLKRPDFERVADDEKGQREASTQEVLTQRPVLHAKRGWPLGKPRK